MLSLSPARNSAHCTECCHRTARREAHRDAHFVPPVYTRFCKAGRRRVLLRAGDGDGHLRTHPMTRREDKARLADVKALAGRGWRSLCPLVQVVLQEMLS